MPDNTANPAENERLKQALSGIVGRLERDAEDRVQKRQATEKRWLKDLAQYQGEYEKKILTELTVANKSTLFINETRPKTNACEARLSDMLFPTDDRNWGVQPTPVPELTTEAKKALEGAEELLVQANGFQDAGDPDQAKQLAQQAKVQYDAAAEAKKIMEEARVRAEAMQSEIDDQLTECSYAIHSRDAIRDACKIGTGILKGPVASEDRARRAWEQKGDEGYQLGYVEDNRPAIYWTDPWGFFPESDARTIEESESTFERHLYTKKQLRGLAKRPGFDKDAIRRILGRDPSKSQPTYLTSLRDITGENQATASNRYQVWEYRGPLSDQDMADVCRCLGKDDVLETIEADPLQEMPVVLWFCEGEVLKFGIHHLDSGESIYTVFNLEKDESSIWGYGIPYVMRHPQKALNGAWRMMMDNAGLSSGPQIEIDTDVMDPADNDWKLTPRKIWLRKANAPAGKTGFAVHNIDSHQGELQAIIEKAEKVIDSVTNISVLAEGEQGTHTTKTAGGMAMLMNAVNVVFRRMVKNFDDDVTVPNIRRMYDWNMQFSKKDQIKGDYQVDARGTSVLLVREVQSQNLMVLAGMTQHPVIGLLLKSAPLVRKLAQSMMIPADEIVLTDDELRDQAQQEANREPEMPPEVMAKQMEIDGRIKVAEIDQTTAMMALAEQNNMTLKDLRAKLQIKVLDNESKERVKKSETASKERIFAGEAAMTERLGGVSTGGGYL